MRRVVTGFFLVMIGVAAPAETVQPTIAPPSAPVVQAFFDYLLQPGTNIATDDAAKERWLSPGLRRLLDAATAAVTAAQKKSGPDAGPDPMLPDNGTFLDSWDPPTGCEATRPVDRDGKGPVPVTCNWGPGTNYPGQSKKLSVMMERAGPSWRLDGIRYFESDFSHANDLQQDLRAIITSSGGIVPDEAGDSRGLIGRTGDFSALLLFTRDETFAKRWYAARDAQAKPEVAISSVLHPGEKAFVYLSFNRPGVDADGIADLQLGIEVFDPSGKTYGQLAARPAMEPGFQPRPGLLYLAQPHLEVRVEDKDPPGLYRVVATLEDRVRHEKIVTDTTFLVEKPVGKPEKPEMPKVGR